MWSFLRPEESGISYDSQTKMFCFIKIVVMHSGPLVISQAPNGISHWTPEISNPNATRDDRGGPGWDNRCPGTESRAHTPLRKASLGQVTGDESLCVGWSGPRTGF